jgi:hypothetical protein
MQILKYEDLFRNELTSACMTIKIKIIQECIQISRPENWSFERHKNLILQVMNTEIYNGFMNRDVERVKKKWNGFLSLKTMI